MLALNYFVVPFQTKKITVIKCLMFYYLISKNFFVKFKLTYTFSHFNNYFEQYVKYEI